jgi:putative SOS response-associated peptidase YedK
MCGRYSLNNSKEELKEWFDADSFEPDTIQPNFNAAPTDTMPVTGENEKGRRSIQPFRWGLLPFWAEEKDIGYSMINARAETIDTKRSYKPSFRKYRCLVPASGFYEWKNKEGEKIPYFIYPTHEPMFAFAGIYNVWKSPDGERIPTYTIITTDANEKIKNLHDRMPVILLKEEWGEWLDPANHDTDSLKELLRPFPEDALDYYRVSKKVSNVRNNSKELIEPVG